MFVNSVGLFIKVLKETIRDFMFLDFIHLFTLHLSGEIPQIGMLYYINLKIFKNIHDTFKLLKS